MALWTFGFQVADLQTCKNKSLLLIAAVWDTLLGQPQALAPCLPLISLTGLTLGITGQPSACEASACRQLQFWEKLLCYFLTVGTRAQTSSSLCLHFHRNVKKAIEIVDVQHSIDKSTKFY